MRPDVHRRLRMLHQERPSEYGKLVQKLLALAFLEAGATAVTDRSTQGIDLEVTFEGTAFAFEVKTTATGTIRLGAKDLAGLAARELEGARPYVAVLGARLLDDWTFARFHPNELVPAHSYTLSELRPYRDTELEEAIARAFPQVTLEHTSAAAAGGQGALDEVLRRCGGFRPA